MTSRKISQQEDGQTRFLGPLETRIMDILWDRERLRIKEVHEILLEETSISFNTVMTVMDRLHAKGYLKKASGYEGRVKPYFYETVKSKQEFIVEKTKAVTSGLIQEYGDLVVSSMIEAFEEADPTLIEKLQQKLEEWGKRNLS